MLFDMSVTWASGWAALLLMFPGSLFCFAFMNVDLLIRLTARFEVMYLTAETLTIIFGTNATFFWSDPRSLVALGFGLATLNLCFVDSWSVPTSERALFSLDLEDVVSHHLSPACSGM